MILDMQNIYIKYLNQTNKTDKKYDEILIYILKLEQTFYINNKKKEQTVFFF